MDGWTWTGSENVNVVALAICLLIVTVFLVLGTIWIRKPNTRKRGLITLAIILVPTVLSAILFGARLLSS